MPEGWPLPWALAEKPEAYLACTCNPLRSVGSPPHARTPTSQHWSRGKEPAQHLASKIKGDCVCGQRREAARVPGTLLKGPTCGAHSWALTRALVEGRRCRLTEPSRGDLGGVVLRGDLEGWLLRPLRPHPTPAPRVRHSYSPSTSPVLPTPPCQAPPHTEGCWLHPSGT